MTLASLLLSACTQHVECEFDDIHVAPGAGHIAVLERCTNGSQALVFSRDSDKPIAISVVNTFPTSLAISTDGRWLYIASARRISADAPEHRTEISRHDIHNPESHTVVRHDSGHIRSMKAVASDLVAYQLRVAPYPSGRPRLRWMLDDFATPPVEVSGRDYGHLVQGNPIGARGLLSLAPRNNHDGGSINQLVWEGFDRAIDRPDTIIREVTDKTYGVACDATGNICLESTTEDPVRYTSRNRSGITVHRAGGTCKSGPMTENVARLAISPDGKRAAYVGGDLVTGRGGQINPRLVTLDIADDGCIRETNRVNLRQKRRVVSTNSVHLFGSHSRLCVDLSKLTSDEENRYAPGALLRMDEIRYQLRRGAFNRLTDSRGTFADSSAEITGGQRLPWS